MSTCVVQYLLFLRNIWNKEDNPYLPSVSYADDRYFWGLSQTVYAGKISNDIMCFTHRSLPCHGLDKA